MASSHNSPRNFTFFNKGISRTGRPRSAGVSERSVAAAGLNLETAQLPPTAIMGTSMLSMMSAPGIRVAAASEGMGDALIDSGLLRRTSYGFAATRSRQREGAHH